MCVTESRFAKPRCYGNCVPDVAMVTVGALLPILRSSS